MFSDSWITALKKPILLTLQINAKMKTNSISKGALSQINEIIEPLLTMIMSTVVL
jgi:hypothetical protein